MQFLQLERETEPEIWALLDRCSACNASSPSPPFHIWWKIYHHHDWGARASKIARRKVRTEKAGRHRSEFENRSWHPEFVDIKSVKSFHISTIFNCQLFRHLSQNWKGPDAQRGPQSRWGRVTNFGCDEREATPRINPSDPWWSLHTGWCRGHMLQAKPNQQLWAWVQWREIQNQMWLLAL